MGRTDYSRTSDCSGISVEISRTTDCSGIEEPHVSVHFAHVGAPERANGARLTCGSVCFWWKRSVHLMYRFICFYHDSRFVYEGSDECYPEIRRALIRRRDL